MTTARPERGACDFCSSAESDGFVWELTQWSDSFAQLLDNYNVDPKGVSIETCLVADWDFFRFTDQSTIRRFLSGVFPDGHKLIEGDVSVGHRLGSEAHTLIEDWDRLVSHLRTRNRFFPPADTPYSKLKPLGEIIGQNWRTVSLGTSLYRGRPVTKPEPLPIAEMGMPPSHLARGGRGNPAGIPHLYLAFDMETCVAECRSGMNEFVSIAEFSASRDFRTLDLETLEAINPFVAGSDGDISNYLHARAVLKRLRTEISIPARSSDSNLDYISTQFLCEFVKSLGLSGVIYPSTLNPKGINLVLFDETLVDCSSAAQCYQVTQNHLKIESVVPSTTRPTTTDNPNALT
ncbi:RES family NAD+ phosphorylase [Rhodococcus sp. 05-2254-6]|uniref:RES family NAD+ phosphorylase n=1 Tax=Rhodococcus sp. 05-2254-6 TaxID=2022489 RepID=UPI0011799372|nr:RES family NAD+ phosphorylase [Rhodococcus sp. 05-2254-6]